MKPNPRYTDDGPICGKSECQLYERFHDALDGRGICGKRLIYDNGVCFEWAKAIWSSAHPLLGSVSRYFVLRGWAEQSD
jgi:hypothetical protein